MSELDPEAMVNEAIKSGEDTRNELNRLTEERKALAAQTQENLKTMNEQLATLMAQVREEFGMPAVSDLSDEDSSSSDTTSTTTAPSLANTTTTAESPNPDDATSADEPYMDPKDFGYESTAGWQVLAESLQLPSLDDGRIEMKIQCDVNGCSLIERKSDDVTNMSGVRSRFISTGTGFRIGFDPDASKSCCALVGGDNWTLSLTFEEMRHFKRLVMALQKRMDNIEAREEDMPAKDAAVLRRSADGLFNIRISRAGLDCSVEHESKLVWTQAIGQPILGQYCIKAIFTEGRKAELYWAPDVIPSLLPALNKVRIE